MSRRDRIRARLIYDRRAILCNLLWKAPYGWISAYDARRWSDRPVMMGFDPGNPNGDAVAYAVHDGNKLTFVDFSEIEQRILAVMTTPPDFKPFGITPTGRYRK